MKYVHSISYTPYRLNRQGSGEWSKYLKNFYSYFLSVLLVKSHGNKIDLYCDERSREIFSLIPYDNIIVTDFFDENISNKFWAYPKIKTQKLLNETAISIDGDVLLFKNLNHKEFKESGGIVQMLENKKTIDWLQYDMNVLSKKIMKYIRPDINWDVNNYDAYNCGVVGFYDNKHREEYCDIVENIFTELTGFFSDKKNYKYMDLINYEINDYVFSSILLTEQIFLNIFFYEKKIIPHQVLPYEELLIYRDLNKVAVKNKYSHLWGSSKYSDNIIYKIKNKIKSQFPEYSYIIDEFEKKYLVV